MYIYIYIVSNQRLVLSLSLSLYIYIYVCSHAWDYGLHRIALAVRIAGLRTTVLPSSTGWTDLELPRFLTGQPKLFARSCLVLVLWITNGDALAR